MGWNEIYNFVTGGGGGAAGGQGPPGPKGQDANDWLSGTCDPTPQIGRQNDLYLNSVTGDVFKKTSPCWGIPPGWLKLLNLKGPIGQMGIPGQPGAPGQPG